MKYVPLVLFSTTNAKNEQILYKFKPKQISLKQNFVFFFLYSFRSSFFSLNFGKANSLCPAAFVATVISPSVGLRYTWIRELLHFICQEELTRRQ